MNPRRAASITLALLLQWLPIARVAFVQETLLGSQFGIVMRLLVGGAALLGSLDAVSGASASVAGLVKYVGNTAVGAATNKVVEPVNAVFKYRIAVKNAGSDFKKDYYDCKPLPDGLTINTAVGGNGYITGMPTKPGTYAVTLTAGNTSYPVPATLNATIIITGADVAPQITTQPQPKTVSEGAAASFSVVATGTAPLTYQWKKDFQPIAGATNATLTLASVSIADAGNYSVTVGNAAGSVDSAAAALIVIVRPTITAQPQPTTSNEGAPASFSVVATGTAPLTYQWKKDLQPIAGATNATLTLASVSIADAGNYSVTVGNAAGSVDSAAAALVVVVRPNITAQPQPSTVAEGSSATFSVTADGTGPLSYQWLMNHQEIPGATQPTFTIPQTKTADAGDYSVKVSNAAGSVTSQAATLTVTTTPPVDVRLSAPSFENGTLRFQISGPAGSKFVIWGSADMIQWINLKTIDGTTLPVEFTDSEATAIPIRFYRVTTAP